MESKQDFMTPPRRRRGYGGKRKARRLSRKMKRSRIATVPKYMGPLLPKIKTNLVYAQQLDLNPGVGGAAAAYVFSCNGLYDPNITGIGHQPRGFDQLMALYDHYVVIAAKINWHFGTTNGSVYDQIAAITIQDDSTVSVDMRDYMERAISISKSFAAGPSGETRKLELGVNPNKFLGRSNPLSDPDLKGSDSTNPAESAFFHLAVAPMQAVDAQTVNTYVQIEYSAIFIEPKDVSLS